MEGVYHGNYQVSMDFFPGFCLVSKKEATIMKEPADCLRLLLKQLELRSSTLLFGNVLQPTPL